MKSEYISTTLKKFIFVTAALAVALTTSYALATWSDPTGTPPANNVAAPVNVSTDPQTKPGMFTTAISRAADEMRAVEYCDYDGDNCVTAEELASNFLPTCADDQVLVSQSGVWLCGDAPSGPAPSCTTQNITRTCTSSCPGGWTKTGEGPSVSCGGGPGNDYAGPTIYCQRQVCS